MIVRVLGSYPGAIGWETDLPEGQAPIELAKELALSAHCRYYTVEGQTYGPFDCDPAEGE